MRNIESQIFILGTDTSFVPLTADGLPLFKDWVLVSADIEALPCDIIAEEVVLNPVNGKIRINVGTTMGQKLRITAKLP